MAKMTNENSAIAKRAPGDPSVGGSDGQGGRSQLNRRWNRQIRSRNGKTNEQTSGMLPL